MAKNQSTESRYYEFLSSLNGRQRGFAGLSKMVRKARLCSYVGPILRDQGLVKETNGIYKWTGPVPTPAMAAKLVKDVNNTINGIVARSKGNGKINTPSAQRPASKKIACAPSSSSIDIASLREKKSALESKIARIDAVVQAFESLQEELA